MRRTIQFLLENSLFLIIGAVGGLVWANLDWHSYHGLVHMELFTNPLIGESHGDPQHKVVTLHYLVNDILMAFFFAIAGKEVWEATFPGGPLNSPKKAATPLIATIGGMAGPALVYLVGAALLGRFEDLNRGWAIPCATDIAFSFMVARLVFGAGHPAIPFLLLLAIADDALGLIILAVVYPQGDVQPMFLLLCVAGMAVCWIFKRAKMFRWTPYLLVGGTLSWFGFALSGLHPALGLLPIVPMLPHAHVDTGLFDWRRLELTDTLTAFEHAVKGPVEFVLGLFGLLNAGVVLSALGEPTWIVLAGLLLGKPLGIFLCGYLAARVFGFGLPAGMTLKDLVVLGCAAGIGFTVALFVTTVAFPAGNIQDSAKMGALGSFGAAILTIVVAKAMGTTKILPTNGDNGNGHGH